jgi:hypothetical protein
MPERAGQACASSCSMHKLEAHSDVSAVHDSCLPSGQTFHQCKMVPVEGTLS